MPLAISVENVSKIYQIGEIGTGTLSHDLERWWVTKVLGREDPFLKIGQTNDRGTKAHGNVVYSLKDINFEIEQGDAVGIIGKNGAGKSTLLKILSRVTAPTTGRINIKGRVASLLEVGTGFHPELTGRENIFLNGAILGMRKKEIARKLDEIIDFSGVERYIDTPVKRYSSGMYVRLAFAVAAHLESEILIVDEVLAVGDAEFQKKCLGKMGEVSKGEGRTVLFVSHNMGSVKNLCSKAILLNNGFVDYEGDVAYVVDYYQKGNMQFIDSTYMQYNNTNNLPVFIKRVQLYINGSKATCNTIDFLDKISFIIELEINQIVKNRGIIIHCYDNTERLFQAFDISKYPELFDGRTIGKYLLNIDFPYTFLREGQYYFDFEVGHFGVGPEQLEKSSIGINVEVMSRNPRFEAATNNRANRIYIEPNWSYTKI